MADRITAKRTARLGIAFALATSGVLLAAAPADAVTVTQPLKLHCKVFFVNPDGSLGIEIPESVAPRPVVVDIDFTLEGPATADAGATFTVTAPGGTENLPAMSGTNVINEVKNIKTVIEVTGAAGIGSATLTGGEVANPTVTPSGSDVTVFFDGKSSPSVHAGTGPFFFAGGSTFTTPKIDIPVTAGAAGTQIVATVKSFETNSVVLDGAIVAGVRQCVVVEGNPVIGTINVVTPAPPPAPPAPPGAPNTANDVRTTTKDTPVTIDVLANDTQADVDTPIDPSSLSIKTNPTDGTAAVVDGKIVYTPNAGFTGRNTFQYEVCSMDKPAPTTTTTTIEQQEVPAEIRSAAAENDPEILQGVCHFAFVTVDVEAPLVVPVTAAPTTAAPATTVAAAAAAELPETGGTSGPLALIGLSFVLGGAMLARSMRSRTEREPIAG